MEELRYRYFVSILIAGGCIALAGWALYLWTPSGSGEIASWIQAIGSIAAIGIAVYAARIQTSAAQRQFNLEVLQAHEGKLRSLIAVLFPAYELFHEARSHAQSVRSCGSFRMTFDVGRFADIDEMLRAVPLHELGSFKSARAIQEIRKAIRRIRSVIDKEDSDNFGVRQEDHVMLLGESEVCLVIVDAAYKLHMDAVEEAERRRMNYLFRVEGEEGT